MEELKNFTEIQSSLVGPLAENELHILEPMLQRHSALPGESLWREGDLDGRWGLVLRGRVKLLKETENPDHRLVLGLFGPGSLILDCSFEPGQTKETSAYAVDDVEILILSKQHFEQVLIEHPNLGHRLHSLLLDAVAEQLRHAYRRLVAIF
jgi:CRP/FNR family transcriptional regulator, cyclic AMP receptor protein